MHGCSAITALTAQNPNRVQRIEAVPVAQMRAELDAVFAHYDVRVVKTGMLLDAEHIDALAAVLRRHHANRPLIVDPVMIASSGRRLLAASAVDVLRERLIPLAMLLTPNLDEAEVLGGIGTDAQSIARDLALRYRCAVLLKGGHAKGRILRDVLCDVHGGVRVFPHPRQDWDRDRSHGTGCRIAAGVGALLAQGVPLAEACRRAIDMLQRQ